MKKETFWIKNKVLSLLFLDGQWHKRKRALYFLLSNKGKDHLQLLRIVWEGRFTVPALQVHAPHRALLLTTVQWELGFWRTTKGHGVHWLEWDTKRWPKRCHFSPEWFLSMSTDWNLRKTKYIWAYERIPVGIKHLPKPKRILQRYTELGKEELSLPQL